MTLNRIPIILFLDNSSFAIYLETSAEPTIAEDAFETRKGIASVMERPRNTRATCIPMKDPPRKAYFCRPLSGAVENLWKTIVVTRKDVTTEIKGREGKSPLITIGEYASLAV